MNRFNRVVTSIVIVVLFAAPSFAQIAFVKTIGTTAPSNNDTSTTITVPADGIAAGNSVIVSFAMGPSAGAVSCSDTGGNAYTSDRDVTNGSGKSGVRTVVLSAHNVIALTSGDTLSCTHPKLKERALSANEFFGLAVTSTVDAAASATGNSTSPASGNTSTTAQASELLIGAIGVESPLTETFTAGASFTTIGRTGTSGGHPKNNITVNPEYRIVSATGAYAATGTLSSSREWAAALVTYKPAQPAATKLVVTSINGGADPTAGTAFSVIVQAQHPSGGAANVSAATDVTLSLNTGGGILGGTLTGTIAAGTHQVTITPVTYTKAESGVVITATRTSGDNLTAGDSSAFTVVPGAAVQLVFITQPTSVTAGNSISGPPTIAIQDSLGNTITTSGASITVVIGINPSGGTLSGTTTKNAVSGVASFTDLSVNLAGNGYTLAASAIGLTGATSSSFNITAAAGVSLAASPSAVAAGNPFAVTWTQIPNPTNRDWIGLYTPGSSDTSYIDYRYVSCTQSPIAPVTSGTCSFPIPTSIAPGAYEFRLFPNDTYIRIATSNGVVIGSPTSLNMLTITVSPPVTAGTPGFFMTVRSQTPSGTPDPVSGDTAISIGLTVGSGVLGGTLNGTILSGTHEVVIGPATYSKAESGVIVTASPTGGDPLTAGASLPITVIPGPAAQLAFTTEPGNTTTGSTIPGPPTVTVQDNAGNAVISTTANIAMALGANPGAGVLSGNVAVNTGSSVAFSGLSIDQPGNGYTLTASSAGLVSATSNPFNIISATGSGAITGFITRVSTGAPLTGALVEAYQGTALRGTAVTDASGNYSITGLAAGSYTVRASFIGLVPQMVNNVSVIDGDSTPVDLSLNAGIAIQSPIAGATITDFSVLVTGFFDTSLAPEVGIKVNGYVALIDGDEFSTIVPIDSQTTTLTAALRNTARNLLAEDAVPITPQIPTSAPDITFQPSPRLALVADPIEFSLVSFGEVSQIELDGNGDGTIDFTGSTLDGVTVSFAEPGLYYPRITVTDASSALYMATGIVQILDINQLDFLLQSKWNAMKSALTTGDTATAASHLVQAKQAFYQNIFNNLTISFSDIDQYLPNLTFVEQWHNAVEYEFTRTEGPDQVTYMVLFIIDDDGIWRIKFF